MTKWALITDTHAGARSDSVLFNDFFFKFWEGTFFPYLEKEGIKKVIHLGDLVDRRKFINYGISNAWHKRFFQRLKEMDVELKVIIGNHDVFYKNSNEINCINQIFWAYDNVEAYTESQDVFLSEERPDEPTAFIPWINSGNYKRSLDYLKNTKAEIAFGHLEISGFEMDRGIVCDSGFNKTLFDKFDRVYTGHFHHKSDDGTICYLGNTYQITWSDYGETRGFHIYDTEKRDTLFVPNPNTMFHKYIYDDSAPEKVTEIREAIANGKFLEYKDAYLKVVVAHKTDPLVYDAVLDTIYKSSPADISIAEDYTTVDELLGDGDTADFGEDTITILNKYIDHLAANSALPQNVDSSRMKSHMRELYVEALNDGSVGTEGE